MNRHRNRNRHRLALVRLARLASLAMLAALSACEAGPGGRGAGRPLPSYAGHAAELFDDSIETAAVGLSLDAKVDPHTDKSLRERTQVGDAVLRVRVTTVTVKQDDSGPRFIVGLQTLDKLAGPFPPTQEFEITVGHGNPSLGILKSMERQVIGKTFITFVRAFVRPDGDEEIHFHLAPDNRDELSAIKDAVALAGL